MLVSIDGLFKMIESLKLLGIKALLLILTFVKKSLVLLLSDILLIFLVLFMNVFLFPEIFWSAAKYIGFFWVKEALSLFMVLISCLVLASFLLCGNFPHRLHLILTINFKVLLLIKIIKKQWYSSPIIII